MNKVDTTAPFTVSGKEDILKQTSSLTRSLSTAQDPPARKVEAAMVYRIYFGYTVQYAGELLINIVSRYFDGATFIHATGIWKGEKENSIVVEVVTDNRQAIYNLAGDIRVLFGQSAVLITWQPVSSFLLTEDSINVR